MAGAEAAAPEDTAPDMARVESGGEDFDGLAIKRVPSYATNNESHHMKVEGKHEYFLFNGEFRKGYIASVMTLCLGIMGGAVLPLPSAFATTGVIAGLLICVLVASANVFTSDLLIRQCYKTGSRDYEDLAYAVGGTPWLAVTSASIGILLFGTIIGSIQQVGEAALSALMAVNPDGLPEWVTYADDSGYVLMVLFTAGIVFPLCMFKELRSLEYAGMVGFVLVLLLVLDVVIQSCIAGLPALESGEFPVGGFSNAGSLAVAVSLLGFAFYIQPLMMPLLNEMPGTARSQARILSWAMRFTVVIFAGGVYVVIGFFGAAWYGAATEGNILQNVLLGGGVGQCVLNFLMAVYLSLAIPPIEFCMRKVIDTWLPFKATFKGFWRNFCITTVIMLASLAVALFWNSGSAVLLSVTGSTGVLMASYICPVVNHFLLYHGWARCQRHAELEYNEHLQRAEGSRHSGHVGMKFIEESGVPLGEALPPIGANSADAVGKPGVLTYARDPKTITSPLERVLDILSEIILPVIIAGFGTFCSVVALYVNFGMPE